jgi:hypothetical protein
MLINCYYYAPHNHTLLADHMKRDLEHMAYLGTDIVSFCVQESQLVNWHQQRLRNTVELIHSFGMKAHVVPNRWAGLLAGWLDGFGDFTVDHRDTWVRDRDGNVRMTSRKASCTQSPAVKEHFENNLRLMLEMFDFDGLIWDEPTIAGACYCEYCRSSSPLGEPTDSWQRKQLACFLDEMSLAAKRIRPQLTISLFAESGDLDFAQELTGTRYIDYIGSDGHVRSENHQMHRMKTTIFTAHSVFYPLMRQSGHKTIFLLEGQRHRDEDLDNYLDNLEKAFHLPMDCLMYYYSAHEMNPNNEAIFNRATWEAVQTLNRLRKQQQANISM